MKIRISIDIRKRDEWGLVGFEFENTHRYLEKRIDLRFPHGELMSNKGLDCAIHQAINDCLDSELLKELEEEDSINEEKRKNALFCKD